MSRPRARWPVVVHCVAPVQTAGRMSLRRPLWIYTRANTSWPHSEPCHARDPHIDPVRPLSIRPPSSRHGSRPACCRPSHGVDLSRVSHRVGVRVRADNRVPCEGSRRQRAAAECVPMSAWWTAGGRSRSGRVGLGTPAAVGLRGVRRGTCGWRCCLRVTTAVRRPRPEDSCRHQIASTRGRGASCRR
jgi:hypothetical protein